MTQPRWILWRFRDQQRDIIQHIQLQQSPENKASTKHRKHEGSVVILGQLKDSQLVTEEKGNLTTYIESQRLGAVDLLVPIDSNQGITLLVQ